MKCSYFHMQQQPSLYEPLTTKKSKEGTDKKSEGNRIISAE